MATNFGEEGHKGHRVHAQERGPAYINYERGDGSQEIGLRALAGLALALVGREMKPTDPDNRFGITFKHDDGSYDTGLRAIANGVRMFRRDEPKIYKRTMRPHTPEGDS